MSTATQLPTWTVAERMVKAREHAGLDQAAMAERLHKGVRSISRYETSENPPRAIVLAYATVTGVPLWWLEGNEDDTAMSALDRRSRGRTRVTVRDDALSCGTLDGLPMAA